MPGLTAKEQADLFKEIQADEAASKLDDAHGTAAQKETYRRILEEKAQAQVVDKDKGREIER